MSNPLVESKSVQLEHFQDALAAARGRDKATYDALFAAPPEGLSVHEINTDKLFVRVSPRHEGLLGYPPQRMLGQPAASFVLMKDVSEMAMKRKLSASGKLEPYARAFLRADGSAVTMLLLDRQILDAAGKITGICTVLTVMPVATVSGSWPKAPAPQTS